MNIDLTNHHLRVAILHRRSRPTPGNIARLCVATGTELHLVRPMGFVLSDRELKRSAMDYWPRLKLTVHDDTNSFFEFIGSGRFWCSRRKQNKISGRRIFATVIF